MDATLLGCITAERYLCDGPRELPTVCRALHPKHAGSLPVPLTLPLHQDM